jgi:hypothetical protein
MTEQIMRPLGHRSFNGPAVAGAPASGRFQIPPPSCGARPALPADAGAPTRSDLHAGGDRGTTLSRLWLDELADEARHVAPFERMATALLVFTSAVTVVLAGGAAARFVEGWDTVAAWVQRLIS